MDSTEQKRTLGDKEGSDVAASEPHTKNGTAR